MKKMTIKERIPSLLLLCLSLLFVFMAFSPSQYELLSSLYQIVQGDAFAGENYYLTLGSLFTIFTILFLSGLVLIALVSFFFDNLFTYHTVHKFLYLFLIPEMVAECGAFVMLIHTNHTEQDYFSIFNILSLILNILIFVGYIVTEILFVGKPYRKLKQEFESIPVKTETSPNAKEEKNVNSQTDAKKEMIRMVTTLLDEKKITKEEADRMIERIYGEKEE